MSRKCYTCKKDKELNEFSKKTKETGGIAYQCIDCRKAENLYRRYGITTLEYNQMFNQQEGKCKICHKHQSELDHSLNIDHCHESNRVRGLLCRKCNTALGSFKDSIELLKSAMEYLKNSGTDKSLNYNPKYYPNPQD